VGISLVTTGLERRGQFHRDRLVGHLDPANVNVQNALEGMRNSMLAHGASFAQATQQAYAMLQGTLQRQAEMLAYIDNFWMLGLATLLLVPCVLLVKRTRSGAQLAMH